MKNWKSISVLLLLATLLVGCATKTNTSVPAAPPAGSLNSFDSTTNTTLETLHGFIGSLVSQNNAGKVTLTATQKADLNQAVTDLNAADAAYQAWHADGGTGPTAAVSAAVAKAQASQTTLNAAIQGGK